MVMEPSTSGSTTPTLPFREPTTSRGNAPATVRALTSHIHIDRSGWKGVRSFRTSGAVVSSPDWTGGFGSMDLYTVAQLRGQHRLITGLPDLIRVIVSGSAPGADPTGITPIQRIDPKAATATVLAAGAGGANAMGIFGKGYAASVAMRQGGGRATFDPRTGQLGLTGTGETKATLDLARTSAAGSVTAGLDIAGGGSSIVTVSRAGVADITHTGTAATVSLRLGSTRAGRMPSGTRSQAIRLGAGERLSVKLAGGRVVGTVTRGGTARRLAIVDTLTPPRRPIIRRVAVTRGNGNLVVTSSIRVAGKASDPVSIGLAVLRGKKVVYRTSLATDPEALRKPLVISTGRIANPKGLRVVLVATAFRVAGGATEAASSGKITNVK